MSTRTQTMPSKATKSSGSVLGRSEATGRFVLKPASKPGIVSLRDAKAAVSTVRGSKKT